RSITRSGMAAPPISHGEAHADGRVDPQHAFRGEEPNAGPEPPLVHRAQVVDAGTSRGPPFGLSGPPVGVERGPLPPRSQVAFAKLWLELLALQRGELLRKGVVDEAAEAARRHEAPHGCHELLVQVYRRLEHASCPSLAD